MLDLDAYCARIGYAGTREPCSSALAALQRLHPAAIAFENLSVLLGDPVPLDLESLQRKLVAGGRGGYCFEHNVLFAAALEALGFGVRRLAARVVWARGREDAARPLRPVELGPRTHMLLRVECEGRALLADVGFGGITLGAPLELEPATEQRTPHGVFRLLERDGELTLQVRLDDAWRSLYRFDLQAQLPADIGVLNHYVATHGDSPMRSTLQAARCSADGRFALRDNSFSFRAAGGREERRTLASAAELRAVLETELEIAVPRTAAADAVLARIAARPL